MSATVPQWCNEDGYVSGKISLFKGPHDYILILLFSWFDLPKDTTIYPPTMHTEILFLLVAKWTIQNTKH